MKVLIADDNADIVESTIDALEIMEVEAVGCTDSAGILDTARREAPDVILQDAKMPGLDLEATLRALRDDPECSGIPVLLFTANRTTVEHLVGDLAQDIVQKPFDLDKLVEQMEQAIAGDR